MNNSRALLVILSIIIFFITLVVKLVDIQIVRTEEYSYYAQRQQTGTEKIEAERGLIFDRNNVLLVYNRADVSFYVDLRMIRQKHKEEIARTFAKKFKKSKNYYIKLMQGSKKTICIEKKVSMESAASLKDLKFSGFFYKDEPTRVYHYNNLAAHVLGYLDKDNKGVMGISEYYEDALNGEDGSRIVHKNAIGETVTVDDEEINPAIPGDDFYLTVDKSYQNILEDELRKGIDEYGAISGTGVIMNPNTGEVLALANIDDFNPNEYWKYNDFQRRNRAITDTYEPGSTFKSFTIASLIDQNLCRLNEKLDLENGKYKFKSVNIRDTHPFKSLNVVEILEQSSNIGVAKLVQRIDDEKYFKYLRGFGFGNSTSLTLPGEAGGKLRKPNEWSKISKTYISFGYEISVTPVQIASGYCALVNGGVLYEPQLIQRQISKDGNLIYEFDPKEVRRVISSETSDIMRDLLGGVVKNGTGKKAFSELISIGGKTGTSQKLVDGSYSKQHYNSSFVGFFPVENPQVVCLILINSPDQGRYGGLVAAPIFKNVTERIVLNDYDKFQDYINPDLMKNLKFAEDNSVNNYQEKTQINPISVKEVKLSSNNKMPDLINCQVKDAIYALTKLGIKYKIIGTGIIKSQSIIPGKKLNGNEVCVIECSEYVVRGASL
ncbi:MAG: transpeptidase family protein [Ignavibacterium sp.]|nr:transpeptidase family protein [Ignavibacterium sp.]